MVIGRAVPWAAALSVLLSCSLLVSCADDGSEDPAATGETAQRLQTTVVRTLDHDDTAFTQGLEIVGDELFESTGRNGTSYVRSSSLSTGDEIARADLPSEYFGEGIAVTDDLVWQITWRNGVAFARDRQTLADERTVSYDGEGWGLCDGGDRGLVMSDGSDTLTFRDRATFDATDTVQVTLDGKPLTALNELECADDGSVYANVWQTYDIARIDPATGTVTALIDAQSLWSSMTADERSGADVLNGIAQIPGTDRFLVTGKLWPTMYEVEFTPTPR